MPTCSCGSEDYKYEQMGADYHLVCQQCRTAYDKRRDDVFVFVHDQRIPYRQLVKHKGWIEIPSNKSSQLPGSS
jgi:hypothetical protein